MLLFAVWIVGPEHSHETKRTHRELAKSVRRLTLMAARATEQGVPIDD